MKVKILIDLVVVLLLMSPLIGFSQEDLNRKLSNAGNNFKGVQQQQGRMATDADSNEASAIEKKTKVKPKKRFKPNGGAEKGKKLKPMSGAN